MSRRRGFSYAQLDATFLADPKFVKLARVSNSHFLEAVGLWAIALAHAWASDDPDVADVLAEHGDDELRALLESCRLVIDGAIPNYDAWTSDVRARREGNAVRQRRFRNAPSRVTSRYEALQEDYDPTTYEQELQSKLKALYPIPHEGNVTDSNALHPVSNGLSRDVTRKGRGGESRGEEQIKDLVENDGRRNSTSEDTDEPPL